SEQQLRQSVQPRLWLEVLLLGLLAEAPATASTRASTAAMTTAASAVPLPSPAQVAAAPPAAPAAPQVTTPAPHPPQPPAPPATAAAASADLTELWQQILAGLELPSTRMLLSQQARLARLDGQRAVVQVAGNWMAMVQSRLPLLEKAVAASLGSPRQVVLEAGHGGSGPVTAPAPAAEPMAISSPPATSPAAAASSAAATVADAPASRPPAAPSMPQHHQIVQPVQPPSTAMAEPALAEPALGGSSDRVPPTPTPPSPPATPAANANATVIDERARRLAEFFNGEVVQLDEPLPGLSGDEAAA
ncbi:MAG: hypothetical protein RLZZ124_1037, partial [Cyanobacteriota bacterium]